MKCSRLAAALLAPAVFACGPPPATDAPSPTHADAIHWGERSEPYRIRMGQLDAVPVNRVESPHDVRIELGGMFVRHYADATPTDELLLYFRAPRAAGAASLPDAAAVELSFDGERFRYSPPEGRSLWGSQMDGGVVIDYVLVPVSRWVMERLSKATFVEGRIGNDCRFEMRRLVLDRLGRLLDIVPGDARFAVLDDERKGLVVAAAQPPEGPRQ